MKKLIFILLFSTIANAQIQTDKQLHFSAGAVIGGITNIAVTSITKDSKKAFWVGLGVSVLAGVTKELYDKNQGGKFDVQDLAFTTAGGVVGSLTINIFTTFKDIKMY